MSFPKDLKYPIDIGTTKQDVIKFDMLKYEPKKGQAGQVGFTLRSDASTRIIGSCFLPIPAGIQDASTVTFNDDSMNAIQAAGAIAAMETLSKGVGAGLDSAVGSVRAAAADEETKNCLLYTSPSPRDQRGSRMPSSA